MRSLPMIAGAASVVIGKTKPKPELFFKKWRRFMEFSFENPIVAIAH